MGEGSKNCKMVDLWENFPFRSVKTVVLAVVRFGQSMVDSCAVPFIGLNCPFTHFCFY